MGNGDRRPPPSAQELLERYGAGERDFRGVNLQGASLADANLSTTDLRGADLGGADLGGADLTGADLRGADLEGAVLHGASLRGADLRGVNFEDANLEGANLEDTNLEGANLKGANFTRANLGRANLKGAEILGSNLEGAILKSANLEGANLAHVNLGGANLTRANLADAGLLVARMFGSVLRFANLRGADLQDADLRDAYLEGANLQDANLQDANLHGADLRGVDLTGAEIWRLKGANLEDTDFTDANLRRANLEGANLEGANLEGANLEGANLRFAKLVGAKLAGANLARGNLCSADLRGVNLEGANLEGADLGRANLEGADLGRANLEGADLGRANLENAKLGRAKLGRANLAGANLVGAGLEEANLEDANLHGADLDGSNLEGANIQRVILEDANLESANLRRADLRGADLRNAYADEVNLEGTNLEGALFAYPPITTYESIHKIKPRLDDSYISEKPFIKRKHELELMRWSALSIRIFYGTNRARTGHPEPRAYYGKRRIQTDDLEMGTCLVSIPTEHHHIGELESPKWWKLEVRENPARHVTLLSLEPLKPPDFFREASGVMSDSGKQEAFVFVHGFKTSFAHAARRTAQLAYDLNFDGAAIFFSWPTRGTLDGYPADEDTIEWSTPYLERFLQDIAQKTEAKRIHLLAHSMGSRALAKALEMITLKHGKQKQPMFRQVILAAPDIGQGIFRQLAKAISSSATRVTLYAASNDKALEASKRFHRHPRAGDSGACIFAVGEIDTVDVSSVNDGLVGHSGYGNNRLILNDIHGVVRNELPPEDRSGLRQVSGSTLRHWVIHP